MKVMRSTNRESEKKKWNCRRKAKIERDGRMEGR